MSALLGAAASVHSPVRGEDCVDWLPYPRSVPLARRRMARLLRAWGRPELLPDAALLVSELGGNAVLHGCLSDRPFRVRTTLTDHALRIEVTDPRGERRPWPRVAGPEDSFGRGLLVVGVVAARWGVHRHGGGKTVWCELDVPGGTGLAPVRTSRDG